jgi:signal transduction histidine kinase
VVIRLPTVEGVSAVDDVSRQHLMRRAATVGLLMRHSVNAGVAVIALAEPASGVAPVGRWLLIGVLLWSLLRVMTRSQAYAVTAIDFGLTLAVCAGIPLLVADPGFYLTNSAPQAIAGTAVVSFAVSLPASVTLPMTIAVAATYAAGTAEVVGPEQVWSVLAVYYFALQWVTASLIRAMLLHVAGTVDRARRAREAAQLAREVDEAVRAFEREQLALLHDTAASTLLMVGQGADLPPERLAAQARRDLDVLREGPWPATLARVDVVGALRNVVAHSRTPTRLEGREQLWVDGEVAHAVTAATREALNNVDRHARATQARVVIGDDSVSVFDDGVGFDQAYAARGHGIAESVSARMTRAGGSASVRSAPGAGTSVVLSWSPRPDAQPTLPVADPDGLIDRIRLIYATALTAYTVANLVTTVPYGVALAGHPSVQTALGIVAGICALLALPALRGRPWIPVWLNLAALAGVMLTQMTLLAPEKIGTQADWVQGGVGWCVLLQVLPMRRRHGVTILTGFWLAAAAVEIWRYPTADALVNIGLGTASILGVQLFALMFDGLMRDAAADVHADVAAHRRLVVAERVARAVAEDNRRRYATLIANVVPLLQRLADGEPVTESMQREARAESRKLRALFDESETFAHPMMRQLRPAIDAAEARGVDVTVDTGGDLPPPDGAAAAALAVPLDLVLSADISRAHVVLGAAGDSVTLSVVCRGVVDPTALAAAATVQGGDVVVTDDTLWLIVERPLAATP